MRIVCFSFRVQCFLWMLVAAAARADSWNGGTGAWGNAGSWSGGVVPNNTTANIVIDAPDFNHSLVQITSATPTISVGPIALSGWDALSLDAGTKLNCGSISSTGTITVGSGASITLGPTATLNGGTILLNGGTLTISSQTLPNTMLGIASSTAVSGSGTFSGVSYNSYSITATLAGGSLNVSNFGSVTLVNSGGLQANSLATLNVTATALSNLGAIQANGGTVNFNVGSFSEGSSGKFVVNGGRLNLVNAFTLSRDDEFTLTSGVATFNSGLTTAGHTLKSTGADFKPYFRSLTNTGTLSFYGGLQLGDTTNAGGRILVTGGSLTAYPSSAIDNSGGTIALSGYGRIFLTDNATLSGGTISGAGTGNTIDLGYNGLGGGTLRDVYTTAAINLNAGGGLAGTIDGSGTINFLKGSQILPLGTLTLAGSGTINLAGCSADTNASSGSLNVSNSSGRTIAGDGYLLNYSASVTKTFRNDGTLLSQQQGTNVGNIHIGVSSFVNSGFGQLATSGASGIYIVADSFSSVGRITVAAGGSLNVSSGSYAGSASLGAITNAGSVTVDNLATASVASINGGTLTSGALNLGINFADLNTLNARYTTTLTAGPTKSAVRANALSVDRLDVNDRVVLVDYSDVSPLAGLTAKLKAGSIAGWKLADGAIFSTTAAADPTHRALGIAELSALYGSSVPITYRGRSVDDTTVLIQYTYAGDANLDGKVNVVDLGLLASHWQQTSVWSGGDFNYDGKVDVVDLGILASTWQLGVTGPAASLADAMASVGLGGANVPEPGEAVLLAATLCLSARRSRGLKR